MKHSIATMKQIVLTSFPKIHLLQYLMIQFPQNIFPRNLTCPSSKWWHWEFTSLTAKSTSPRLSDMTFFAHCRVVSIKCHHLTKTKVIIVASHKGHRQSSEAIITQEETHVVDVKCNFFFLQHVPVSHCYFWIDDKVVWVLSRLLSVKYCKTKANYFQHSSENHSD